MIAATIGRKFLLAYNRKFGTHYDAKTFFTEQYFPLFFDHEKYMQWVTNSPFVQGIKKGKCLTAVERREKLRILQERLKGMRQMPVLLSVSPLWIRLRLLPDRSRI